MRAIPFEILKGGGGGGKQTNKSEGGVFTKPYNKIEYNRRGGPKNNLHGGGGGFRLSKWNNPNSLLIWRLLILFVEMPASLF